MIRTYDTNPEKLHVYFGPAIHAHSYTKSETELSTLSGWESFVETDTAGLFHIDLIGFNIQELLTMHVPIEHITINENDTYTSDVYFSHARALKNNEVEGRMMTVVSQQ